MRGPGEEYLHTVEQFEEWLEELKKHGRASDKLQPAGARERCAPDSQQLRRLLAAQPER